MNQKGFDRGSVTKRVGSKDSIVVLTTPPLKQCRLDADEVEALRQGVAAIGALMDLTYGKNGCQVFTESMEEHLHCLGELVDYLDNTPATTIDCLQN